jgi:predicted RNase H-like HicB family nuclease
MLGYFAVVFESPLGGAIINFPDLPECATFAHTLELSRAAAAEALAEFLNHMSEIGQTIPHPSPLELLRLDPQNIGCTFILVEALSPSEIAPLSHAG